jgi:hypothetical protein
VRLSRLEEVKKEAIEKAKTARPELEKDVTAAVAGAVAPVSLLDAGSSWGGWPGAG